MLVLYVEDTVANEGFTTKTKQTIKKRPQNTFIVIHYHSQKYALFFNFKTNILFFKFSGLYQETAFYLGHSIAAP